MAFRSIMSRFSAPWSTTPRTRALGSFTFYFFTFATWIPAVSWFNNSVLELTTITGPSMYPFFNAEKDKTLWRDLVVNFKWGARDGLHRGMIVTFWNPLNPESVVVKRIVGLEGDVMRTRAPYPNPRVKVPPGHIWVEGDGAERDSRDSNTYGPISSELIIGKVTHIVWPFHRAGQVKWWEHTGASRPRL